MKRKGEGLPPKQRGEEPATDAQLGFLRSLADIDEDELINLGKWQASHLIDKLVKARDSNDYEEDARSEERQGARTHGIGGLFKLALFLILAYFGWKTFSSFRDSKPNSSEVPAVEVVSSQPTPAHTPPQPLRAKVTEGDNESVEQKTTEPPATPSPHGTLATLEDITLPVLLVTTEEFSLRDAVGKEAEIPIGTSIRVTERSPHGTLTTRIGNSLFVGNESRLAGKVRIKEP